jgi:AraC-like DNA-binding protein
VIEYFPLSWDQPVSTTREDEAENVLSQCLIPVKIARLSAPRRFRLDMSGHQIGRLFLGVNRFEEDTELDAGDVENGVCIVLGYDGSHPSHFKLDDEWVSVSTTSAAVVSPNRRTRIRRIGRTSELVVRTSSSVLEERFAQITGKPSLGPVVFGRSVDLSMGAGLALRESILSLVENQNHEVMRTGRSLASSLLEDVIVSLILNLSGNSTQQIAEAFHGNLAPSTVREAEDYMAEHVTAPISLSNVIAACGCSRSALYAAFKSSRGYTPMQFLLGRRLELAHQRLMQQPLATLTEIAIDCGFSNHGRFVAAYRHRFGETPSDTRAKNRRARI